MRRFDVYFLQKRGAAGWETLERAQSASVLISSMVREFDGHEDAELRVVAGDWNDTIGEWEFSQIFFVDRGSIDLQLAEALEDLNEAATGTAAGLVADEDIAPTPAAELSRETGSAPAGDSDFAAAIRAASEEADREAGLDANQSKDPEPDDDFDMPEPGEPSTAGRRFAFDDDTNEDLRSLGFTQAGLGAEEPDAPPPQFRPEPRRRGRAFFMAGTLLIALILIVGAAVALMVAFKVDPAPRYIEMFKQWRAGAEMPAAETGTGTGPVVPQTAGQVARFDGVVPELRGRWSAGDCATEYIEFDVDGFVIASPGRPPSTEVPVVETLIDDYTWYVRRSDTLVEHYQRLGNDDIQMIGDTTPVGFTQRTSEVFSRCR